jgi:hypothetical protein
VERAAFFLGVARLGVARLGVARLGVAGTVALARRVSAAFLVAVTPAQPAQNRVKATRPAMTIYRRTKSKHSEKTWKGIAFMH